MQNDIREPALYQEAEALYRAVRQPGTGQIGDAAELSVSPDGERPVFAGTLMTNLRRATDQNLPRGGAYVHHQRWSEWCVLDANRLVRMSSCR